MRSSAGLVAGGYQWSPASRATRMPGGRGGKARIMRRFARDGYRRILTPRSGGQDRPAQVSDLGQRDALLTLIFAAAVLVRGLADFVGLEEDHLRNALVGVDFRGQRRGVGKLQRDIAFPLGLERRDVDDDAAAGVRALAQTNCEHISGDAEVLHRAGERKRVRRDDAPITAEVDKGLVVEILRI